MDAHDQLREWGEELTALKSSVKSGERYTRLYDSFLALYLRERAWETQVIEAARAETIIKSRGHYETFISQDRPRHYYAYNGRWRWLESPPNGQWRQERLFGGRWVRSPTFEEIEPPYYVKLHSVGKGHALFAEAWSDDRRLGVWQPPAAQQ